MTPAAPTTIIAAMKLSIPYVHEDRDRHGNVRVYYRRRNGGPKVRLRATPGTAAFAEEIAAAAAWLSPAPGSKPKPPAGTTAKPVPGSLRALWTEHQRSQPYLALDPRTRHTRALHVNHMLAEPIAPGSAYTFADYPVASIGIDELTILRDRRADRAHAANARVRALRAMWGWAADSPALRRAYGISSNVARDLRYLRGAGPGHHSWTIAEVEQYEARWPVGTRQRLALAILLYTGQRRSDVVRLGRQHVRDGWIKFTQHKGRNKAHAVTLELPILPELQAILDAGPTGDLTWLVSGEGRPYSADGFGIRFRAWCDAAGLPHCSAHGLRKAGAVIAAENGATASQLMSIFGWLTLTEAERYTRAARQRRLAGRSMHLLTRRTTTGGDEG